MGTLFVFKCTHVEQDDREGKLDGVRLDVADRIEQDDIDAIHKALSVPSEITLRLEQRLGR
jgi:hypothetical protein